MADYSEENKTETPPPSPTKKPEGQVDNATADKIFEQASLQLQTSISHKRVRFEKIKENEQLYHNIIGEKSIRNPFNECFPFMAGFVDHLKAKIEDDSNLQFIHEAEADLKRSQKIGGAYDRVSKSVEANDSWDLKHRYAKTNALFSGVAIYHYFAQGDEKTKYKSTLEVVSHYDFHCEPRGGGQIENHLFCGTDNIFKTQEELQDNESYDQGQVTKLLGAYKDNQWKDNADLEATRNNRFSALDQDPALNNYVGQSVIKLVQFYTTYKGKRYYILFNDKARVWVKCCLLTHLFPDDLYPYVTWHTNEDPDIFWSKAPCDDARGVARIINQMVNQELYNRQKINYGQRGYDVEMFPNVAALADWRPDGLVPVDTKGGVRAIASGIFEFKTTALSGTLDLVTWLETFTGKQVGYTSSAAGQSESDKKVGVFQGEIDQVEQLIGIKNKSYRDALSRLGRLFKQGLDHHLTTEMAVKVMGGKGVEWTKLSPADLKTEQDLTIQPVGGLSELRLKEIEKQRKAGALAATVAVNPQWKDRTSLLIAGFTEDEVKEAFSADSFAQKELLSEAAQAEKDIVEGKTPKLNRGANAAFMQHIVDFAVDTNELPLATYNKLIEYAEMHMEIALENMNRDVKAMLAERAKARLSTPLPQPDGGIIPGNDTRTPSPEIVPAPEAVPIPGLDTGNQPPGVGDLPIA